MLDVGVGVCWGALIVGVLLEAAIESIDTREGALDTGAQGLCVGVDELLEVSDSGAFDFHPIQKCFII